MADYNKKEIQNYKLFNIKNMNNYKNKSYRYGSTDNIFENNKENSLHKIYNKFLVNPYLIRNRRYPYLINSNNETNQNKYNNNFHYITPNLIKKNMLKSQIDEENNLNKSNEKEKEINFPSIDEQTNNNMINSQTVETNNNVRKIRNKIYYRNNREESLEENKANNMVDFPRINSREHNTIERPIEYNINNNNDIYYTKNKNQLNLSYDVKNERKYQMIDNHEYISPIIAKIAKHNYLMRNPFSDKNEYLGPSRLRNNPILYPISTYKFDFDRYIKNYHVHKFV